MRVHMCAHECVCVSEWVSVNVYKFAAGVFVFLVFIESDDQILK